MTNLRNLKLEELNISEIGNFFERNLIYSRSNTNNAVKTSNICCIVTTNNTYTYTCKQNHNNDTIKTSEDTSLEKYTSHFF